MKRVVLQIAAAALVLAAAISLYSGKSSLTGDIATIVTESSGRDTSEVGEISVREKASIPDPNRVIYHPDPVREVTVGGDSDAELPEDISQQLKSTARPELPEDLKAQLLEGPGEVPSDLAEQTRQGEIPLPAEMEEQLRVPPKIERVK